MRPNEEPGIGYDPERFELVEDEEYDSNLSWQDIADLAPAVLYGLASVLSAKKVYADLPHWGLVRVESATEGLPLSRLVLAPIRFMPYVVINALCHDHRMSYIVKDAQSHLGKNELNAFLGECTLLSKRLTLQVLVESQSQAGDRYLLLRRRSSNVSHYGGTIQFTVGGGYKRNLDVEGKPALSRALVQETLLETGIYLPRASWRVVCLSISNADYSPLLTAVVSAGEASLKLDEEREDVGIHGDYAVRDRIWLPHKAPRDWWEGTHFIRLNLPEGASLVGDNHDDRYRAWSRLGDFWEGNETGTKGSMDRPTASAIATMLQGLEACSKSDESKARREASQ